ncbi:MAG: type II toxin-antitoxin system RelE/ParE family toxin [Cyclobacteriaceae bacterium]|nr:type II toxin-antitoxin system RelE/ParE family toxin [Cyclobacteriaceae bacterium HetDA_MAG_MS6]
MSYSIEITEAAEDDIREAFLWYEDQKDSLGSLFEDRISKAIESIQSNPLKTQIQYGSIRVFFLEKFHFGIHFQADEKEKSILIVGVIHTSRNPENWKGRS